MDRQAVLQTVRRTVRRDYLRAGYRGLPRQAAVARLLRPALATLNNIAGPITGFFTGPLVGATSDGLTSKFGRHWVRLGGLFEDHAMCVPMGLRLASSICF